MRRLVFYELKKSFFHWSMLAVLLLFTLINTAKIINLYQTESIYAADESMSQAYHELYTKYQGQMTAENIQSLLELYRPIEEKLSDFTATDRTDVEGTLTGNWWKDNLIVKYCYVEPMEYLYTYQNLAVDIINQAKENISLYSSVGNQYEAAKNRKILQLYRNRSIDSFYSVTGFQFLLHYDFSLILTILIILYGLSQVFSRDKECDMDILIYTTPKGGNPTIFAKIIAASLFLGVISLWFSLNDWLVFSMTFGLGKAGTLPVYAVESLSMASFNLSLNQYTVVNALSRVVGFWTLGMIFLLIGQRSRHALVPFAVSGGLFLIVVLAGVKWSHSSIVLAKIFNPYSLLTGYNLFGKTEFINLFGYPVLSWQVALVMAGIIGLLTVLLIVQTGATSKLKRGRNA